jgi:hypothetical protein
MQPLNSKPTAAMQTTALHALLSCFSFFMLITCRQSRCKGNDFYAQMVKKREKNEESYSFFPYLCTTIITEMIRLSQVFGVKGNSFATNCTLETKDSHEESFVFNSFNS